MSTSASRPRSRPNRVREKTSILSAEYSSVQGVVSFTVEDSTTSKSYDIVDFMQKPLMLPAGSKIIRVVVEPLTALNPTVQADQEKTNLKFVTVAGVTESKILSADAKLNTYATQKTSTSTTAITLSDKVESVKAVTSRNVTTVAQAAGTAAISFRVLIDFFPPK